MSRVTFVPKGNTSYTQHWPNQVVGEDFIDLRLMEINDNGESAIYVDNFKEEYEFWSPSDGEWTVEVRED